MEEQKRFLKGLKAFGKDYKKIAEIVGTRNHK